MLLRRNLCFALLFAAILILMLASQKIQKRHFLPLSSSLPSILAAAPVGRDAVIEGTAPPVDPGSAGAPAPPGSPQEAASPMAGAQKNPRSCGCAESCISDLETSDWFSRLYDPGQEPVLRDSDSNLDPDSLKWWMSLQRSGNSRTLAEVTAEMFQVVAPPTLDFKPRPSTCRSCAVVGNSGNLQRSGHGNLINSHSSVIRMNKAVTRGFEKDVGNRTTHHFMYPESAVDLVPGQSLVLLPFKLRDLEWLSSALSTGEVKMTYMRVKERVAADKDKILVINPVFMKYVHDHWTEQHGRYPSTGMFAIIFALHMCDQVSVFGYGADKNGNWHHYWEDNHDAGAFKKTGVHSGDYESKVIQKLAEKGKITLHL